MCDGQNEAVSWSRQDKSISRKIDMTQKGEREDHAGQGTRCVFINERVK